MLFITLLCISYQLNRPAPVAGEEPDLFLFDTKQEPPDLSLWQREASEKAVERYTATQEKKWRHWNEAMFERSD
jgi:hypothetical protein